MLLGARSEFGAKSLGQIFEKKITEAVEFDVLDSSFFLPHPPHQSFTPERRRNVRAHQTRFGAHGMLLLRCGAPLQFTPDSSTQLHFASPLPRVALFVMFLCRRHCRASTASDHISYSHHTGTTSRCMSLYSSLYVSSSFHSVDAAAVHACGDRDAPAALDGDPSDTARSCAWSSPCNWPSAAPVSAALLVSCL